MFRRRVAIAVVVLLLYVGSYLALSRPAFAEARRYNGVGFYFFPPQSTWRWRYSNFGCVFFYYPLIVLDTSLGTGMPPAKEPLWGLSR
jgi:hypothetical protein